MKYSVLALFCVYIWFNGSNVDDVFESKKTDGGSTVQEIIKSQAFTVLREKCNVCHATKKRTDIFTLLNMDSLAPDIHKQVFVKEKMPKGRKIVLTEIERSQLKAWLDQLSIER